MLKRSSAIGQPKPNGDNHTSSQSSSKKAAREVSRPFSTTTQAFALFISMSRGIFQPSSVKAQQQCHFSSYSYPSGTISLPLCGWLYISANVIHQTGLLIRRVLLFPINSTYSSGFFRSHFETNNPQTELDSVPQTISTLRSSSSHSPSVHSTFGYRNEWRRVMASFHSSRILSKFKAPPLPETTIIAIIIIILLQAGVSTCGSIVSYANMPLIKHMRSTRNKKIKSGFPKTENDKFQYAISFVSWVRTLGKVGQLSLNPATGLGDA